MSANKKITHTDVFMHLSIALAHFIYYDSRDSNLSSDFLHDLGLGQNVQDFWHRVHSVPPSSHALSDESCVHQA